MDIRQLRHFVTIVDMKSMSKAAAHWNIAQPTLSQQIASLESELDVQLFVRSTHGVDATSAGMTLYRHARLLLKQFEEARREVKKAHSLIAGTVAIGLPTTIAPIIAMPLLRTMRELYPDVRLQIFESMSGYLAELLSNGRLDFAVLFNLTESRGFLIEPLLEEELLLMGDVNIPLEAGQPMPIERLGEIPLALPSVTQELRRLVEKACIQASVHLDIIAELDSLPSLLASAAEGFAATILPHTALAYSNSAYSIPCRTLAPNLYRSVSLGRLKSMPVSPAAEVVYKHLLDLAADAVSKGRWKGATLANRVQQES